MMMDYDETTEESEEVKRVMVLVMNKMNKK